MDEELLRQLVAELIESHGVAMGLFASALSEQLDAQRLAEDLRQRLRAARSQQAYPVFADRLATHVLEAVESVANRQG